jgi:UDP-N-acetylglucosamine acyltransferase
LIHHTAVIDPGAELDTDVVIGPYAVIGAQVQIGRGTRVGPHTVIMGPSRIGENNNIYQFASLGDDPQDKKYQGELTRLEVGNGNVFREYVSVNRGTAQDRGLTRIGDGNWVMAYAHIAHDCRVGNGTVFANNASLAGHVTIEDFAVLGGFTLVHQFCAIGAYAFASFGSVIGKDVPPCVMVSGNPARAHGINTEGLKRHGFGADRIESLRRAYKLLYRSGLTLEAALQQLRSAAREQPELVMLVDFLVRQTRGIVR